MTPAAARTCASSPPRPPRSSAGFRACKRCRPDATPGSPEWDAAGRPGRPGDAADRRRRGRPGGRGRAGQPARLQRAPPAPAAGRRGRRRPARAGPGAARADRPAAARDHRAADHRRRVRGRVRQRPPVQRHDPDGLRGDPDPARAGPGAGRPSGSPARSCCGCRTGRRSSWTPCCGSSPPARCPASRSGPAGSTAARCGCHTGPASSRSSAGAGFVRCELRLTDLRDLAAAVQRCRRLLDLDADPVAVQAALGADPLLGAAGPQGARAAGARARRRRRDGGPRGARPAGLGRRRGTRLASRLTEAYGEPLAEPVGGVTHLFPTRGARGVDRQLPMPRSPGARGRASAALAEGGVDLDPGADRAEAEAAAGAARHRPVDRVLPGDAGARDPDVFLPPTSACATRSSTSAYAGARRRRPSGPPLAALALLRRHALWKSEDQSADDEQRPSIRSTHGRSSEPDRRPAPDHRRGGAEPASGSRRSTTSSRCPRRATTTTRSSRRHASSSPSTSPAPRDFDLPLSPGGTPFQTQVWQALRDIPYGETMIVRRDRPGHRAADGVPRGGSGQRPQPDRRHRPVPSGDRRNGMLTGYAGGAERKARAAGPQRGALQLG